ncbi:MULTISPECIES: HD family hydrolase [Alphaproteobacteria]|uniref:Hydrolase n=2 Tax=Alphaproteobacteria TaxID=28211 RepID=A0A512HGC1_9HYPH|nr:MULTISPECIES: HD family hydrolase [Alphaproteobacteria]GEO84497.1 hydrolase [Ciceribacter naphthalenivorans]GLR22460.1 hydrolase [Ciceribacter naphthalenivorans]GLT05316.1 hydrolase [Sphingomonas psychrolutea]
MAEAAALSGRAWQRMLSGRRLDLLDPSPLDVEISDIAHGLARVARWNGQTFGDHAFSVAQHSLIVEDIFRRLNPKASADDMQMALLHDGPEYVIGDMISPFKAVVGGGYKLVEKRLEAAIHLRFGLPAHPGRTLKAQIKKADTISAYFEATELAGFSEAEARKFFGQPRGITRDTLPIKPLPAYQAQALFIERFEAIEAMRGLGEKVAR